MQLRRGFTKNMGFLFAALGLAACGGGSLGDQPTLTGQIDAWNKGSGYTLQAFFLGGTSSSAPIATAPIDASGNFSIVLPGSAIVTPLLKVQHVDPSQLPSACSGSVQIDPQDFGSGSLSLKAVSGTSTLSVSHTASADTSLTSSVLYSYVDRDVSESGEITCKASAMSSASTKTSINAHLRTGWNRVVLEVLSVASDLTSIKEYDGAPPDGVKWIAR
jgi:hypothetical protein